MLVGYGLGVAVALIVHFGVGSDDRRVQTAAAAALVALGGVPFWLVRERRRPRDVTANATDRGEADPVLRRHMPPEAPRRDGAVPVAGDAAVGPANRPPPGDTALAGDPPAAATATTGTGQAVKSATDPVASVDAEPPAADAAPVPPGADPDALIAAWVHYRDYGDGHFTGTGFQDVLDARGVDARVQDGAAGLDAADNVLVVVSGADDRCFHVVPNFTKSRKAVSAWFEDAAGGALGGRVRNLSRLAEGRRTGDTVPGIGEVVRKGSVS